MASRASIARHPIHPMFVVFPIGLWVFALVCDLIFHWGSHLPFWKDVAFDAMVGGLIGALAAAIPGLLDYSTIADRAAWRIATAHLTLNLVVVVLYAVNLWLRHRAVPEATGPVWLSVVSIGLLVVSGWLGGSLVYEHGVAVEPRRPSTSIDVTSGVRSPRAQETRRPARRPTPVRHPDRSPDRRAHRPAPAHPPRRPARRLRDDRSAAARVG
jgi:uncharacterized membrane protein